MFLESEEKCCRETCELAHTLAYIKRVSYFSRLRCDFRLPPPPVGNSTQSYTLTLLFCLCDAAVVGFILSSVTAWLRGPVTYWERGTYCKNSRNFTRSSRGGLKENQFALQQCAIFNVAQIHLINRFSSVNISFWILTNSKQALVHFIYCNLPLHKVRIKSTILLSTDSISVRLGLISEQDLIKHGSLFDLCCIKKNVN